MNKKILLFNASGLKEMVCPERAKKTILEGYKEKVEYNDTFYGTCFHKYASTLTESSGNLAVSLKAAEQLWKSKKDTLTIRGNGKAAKNHLDLLHLQKTCIEHQEKIYPTDDFVISKGKDATTHLVEIKFHVPFYSDDEIDVVLVGTLDKIGKFKNGAWSIGDYKTTSTWDKEDYLAKFKMSAQLKFYLLMLKKYAVMYPDSIFAEIVNSSNGQIGCFIDGVFLSSTKPTEFKRSEVWFFKDEEMEEFEEMLMNCVSEIVEIYKGTYKAYRYGIITGVCTSIYGKRCPYYDACAAPNEAIAGHVLKNNFIQSEYGMNVYGGGEE